MGLKESLSGISTDLDKILKQLKDIEAVQTRINKGGASYAAAVGAAGGNPSASVGGSGFSTPPASPGTYASGVTATSSGGGGGGGEQAKGLPGWAKATALVGAAAATGIWNSTPGTEDAVTYQEMRFRSSFLSPGGYRQDDFAKMRTIFGRRETDPFGMMTAANVAAKSGNGIGTANFSTVMSQTATTSLIFGQSNAVAAQAQNTLNQGPMAGRLARTGIFVSDLQTGNLKSFGNIIDQIWARAYGSKNAKVSMEAINADLRGGYLGAWLRRNFGDQPALYDQIYQALIMKAKANGKTLDYSDVSGSGKNSALGFSSSQGLNNENSPVYKSTELSGSQSDAIAASSKILLEEWRRSIDVMITANDTLTEALNNGNWLGETITKAKAVIENFFLNNPLLSPLLTLGAGAAGAAIPGLISGLFGTAAKTGTDVATEAAGTVADVATGSMAGGDSLILAELKVHTGLLTAIRACACSPSSARWTGGGDFGRGDYGGGDFGGGPANGLALGGPGTTTSDSVRATLSRGEYVINARAAQMIGTENLDRLNSMGHNFGSGFASPAKAFAKGGAVTASDVISLARTKIGAPYVASADGPDEFDCSGFTEWVYETNFGIPLSEVSYTQVNEHQLVAKAKSASETVSTSLAQPGDLLFFDTDAHENDPSGLGISHVAIYSGNNHIIHAWGPPLAETDLAGYHSPLRAITRPLGGGAGSLPASSSSPSSSSSTDSASSGGEVAYSVPSAKMSLLSAAVSAPTSLSGFSGGAAGLSLGLKSAFSWVGATLFKMSASGVTSGSSGSTKVSKSKADSGNVAPTGGVGTGKGPEWLYDYLVSKGLRGNDLHIAWVLGMRESGGDPNNTTKGSMSWNWDSSESPHYDVGLFQVNNRNLPTIKSVFGSGANMKTMLDVDKNYQMLMHMSKNLRSLGAWALSSDGQTFDWSTYGGRDAYSYAAETEVNHARLWEEYNSYNKQNYSEGAYRTHTGMAQLHEGEMVLPANVAEKFREVMREAGGPGRGRGGDINITLKIEKASDAEAERFARKVKSLLEQENWETSVRSR